MSIRRSAVVAAVWCLSLVAVGFAARGSQTGATSHASDIDTGRPAAEIITGENIGFRLASGSVGRPGEVTGQLMVKIDGQWKEVVPPMRIVR